MESNLKIYIRINQSDELYCFESCPKGRKDVGAMIFCDWCKQWYHYSGVNLTTRKAKRINKYKCAKCL